MSSKRRGFRDGAVEARGENTWRLRYRIKGQRFTKTVHGSKSEAIKALRDALHAGDTGTHVAPDRLTVEAWVEVWLSAGAPGQRRKAIGARAQERYAQLLRCHVFPALGGRPLQQLQSTEIDNLYSRLAETMAAPTLRYVHIVLCSCLATAARTGKISVNPLSQVVKVPANKTEQRATALEAEQLRALVQGFRGTSLSLIVAVAAFTGARRGEILALRWDDLDVATKTLRIERSVDETRAHGLRIKSPKSARGVRAISIDAGLIALLLAERDRHLRLIAGVPESAPVDLSLVKLPTDALMFPAPPSAGKPFSFTRLRVPRHVTKAFERIAPRLGFERLRFHDLRATHGTMLPDAGLPAHVVAERLGHDTARPAIPEESRSCQSCNHSVFLRTPTER
ncbi:MAG TPA: site-specific integrase [Xanthobacteraceae bacterium]|jgi:integrase|nr:site-specific integrase [Xanthobacteraceae bacterium]